jgi:hypothetical protein
MGTQMNVKALLGCTAIVAGICAGGIAQAAGFDGDTIHAYFIFPNPGVVFADLGTFVAPGGLTSFSASGAPTSPEAPSRLRRLQ